MAKNSVVDDGIGIKREWVSGNEVEIAFDGGAIVFTINGEVVYTDNVAQFIQNNVCPPEEYPEQKTVPDTFIRALGADSNRPDQIGAEPDNDVYEYERGLFTWVGVSSEDDTFEGCFHPSGSDDEAQFRTDWSFTTIADTPRHEQEYEILSEVWENKVA